jgi:acetyl esterase/lipase
MYRRVLHSPTLSLTIVLAAVSLATACAAAPPGELLWPDGAPLAKGNSDNDKPTLTVCLPPADKATGQAIVICPGGGYGHLALDHEGQQVAAWLNANGIAGFILKYRHSGVGYAHPAPLLDALRAVRLVRSRAAEWKVDPARVGILGFSAGGHLASTVGTHCDAGDPDAADPIDRVSSRPDFMVLIYPVVSLTEPFRHKGSRDNLLGSDPNAALVENLSNEKQVTPRTPPTFLVHTTQDTVVPVENSLLFYQALRKAGVPAELHVYARGEHGFGLGKPGDEAADWPGRCLNWLKTLEPVDKK